MPRRSTERQLHLAGRLLVLAACAVLLYQAADVMAVFPPRPSPFLYLIYQAGIILPIHEGGHFLFQFFGDTLHALGGSFWQVMFPLLLVIVAARQRSFWCAPYLVLTGANLVDLTSYIFDAPFQSLELIGGRRKVGHDWNHLLIQWNMLGDSETLADIVYYGGIVLGACGLIAGIVMALQFYRRDNLPPISPPFPHGPL